MADQIELRVPAQLDGARVDKALADLLGVSRARASLLIEDGVTLDGEPTRGSDRVTTGQKILTPEPAVALALSPEDVPFDVLFADEDVIVVDKPPGVVVHPGSGQMKGTLAAGLINRFPELVGVGDADRWGLVHRLDKDTSGTILVARNDAAHATLTSDLRHRRVGRKYVALVEGTPGSATGTIDAPIGRDPAHPTRRALSHTGKQARTHYELIRYFDDSDATLVEVTLETGRTHQIRVHMAAIGHPVAGDRLYGSTRIDLAVPRTFLHASRLTFTHPTTGESMVIESHLPDDLAQVLTHLS